MKNILIPGSTQHNDSSPGAVQSKTVSGSTNVGAIAGGVVGGVAGLAIAVMLVFFLLHHRRKISTQDQDTDVHHLPDVEASQINGELDESCAKVELPVKEKTHELGQEWFQKLDPERIYELDGPEQYHGRL